MSLCPICQAPERPFFSAQVLGKYDVTYFFCSECRFLHTEKPYWLAEAYADAIVASDTGIVRRNLDASAKAAAVFAWIFSGRGKYLDMAGGYGLFTRLMRDMGFDCYWSDPYASNCFARGFEAEFGPSHVYRGVTAFEALEHMESPLDFVRSVFDKTGCDAFLFSTELYTEDEPPMSWWYYGRHSGQHISFFHRTTLERMAALLGMELRTTAGFHLLSRRPTNRLAYRILTSRVCAKIAPVLFSVLRTPKIADDHESMLRRMADPKIAGSDGVGPASERCNSNPASPQPPR
jgi:hypothetical protein